MENTVGDYEAFWRLTKEMQASIEKENWEKISRLASERQGLLDRMATQEDERLPMVEDQRYLADLIKKTLTLNGEIQSVLETKKGELARTFVTEKKMRKAYGAQTGRAGTETVIE